MDATGSFCLYKHDEGTVFGPLPFEHLHAWAMEARISPLDGISTDNATWIKAPMMPELEMDWIIQVGPEDFYGPTTIGAMREFHRLGEISDDTPLINSCRGTRHTLREVLAPSGAEETVDAAGKALRPRTSSLKKGLQQRLHDLEETLLRERRQRAALEERCQKLEARLRAAALDHATDDRLGKGDAPAAS